MTADPAAGVRQRLAATVAADLAADTGPRWDTEQMTADFDVVGFLAPFVVVRRKSDQVLGTLMFTGTPRVYFGWQQDQKGL
jgi:hypothetical protein